MKIQEIRELIKLVDQSSIDEFEMDLEGTKITMRKSGATTVSSVPAKENEDQSDVSTLAESGEQPAGNTGGTEQHVSSNESAAKPEGESELHTIESPMVGTFYTSPSPDEDPYVRVGDKVKPETVVCIVEAMKLFNEIEADQAGEIVEVHVENGELVEYGQPLFSVKPE